MIRVEAITLEDAYAKASMELDCSVTELTIEVVQYPSNGFLGLFKKNAIVVASKKPSKRSAHKQQKSIREPKKEQPKNVEVQAKKQTQESKPQEKTEKVAQAISQETMQDIAKEVKVKVNELFKDMCFDIDEIEVSVYDENVLLVELKGEDSALLIGKEGYRYKALSYMLFNWLNSKYNVGLRLEIAEFLKNQEESVGKYLESVKEIVDKDGRAQTKILDGVLVQIALKDLRETYPNKYVAIRTTRDGLKYIIINDYNY